ncbi:MAG: tRNA pseudouridine(65) synthase TruC [Bdellovibrionaceae bacterium]|jgi:tRNA pseudouridine65 synthase|nr:tRNA pseudouridine(65) synthase TruC [Pseudobdellovibrionaceae bacterium]
MQEILYSDEHLCIIRKNSGHVVHKTRGAGDSPIILQDLRDQLGQKVYPIHRLDRGTSGCLIFALSSEVARLAQDELQKGSSIKKYTSLCRGNLPAEGVYNRELSNEKKEKQTAITKFRVIQEFQKPQCSLLELEIFTGRKHQIRRHLSFDAHHIVGDVNYGKGWLNKTFRENYNFHRMFLHCHFLSITHPISGERLNIHCELDSDLKELLVTLEKDK